MPIGRASSIFRFTKKFAYSDRAGRYVNVQFDLFNAFNVAPVLSSVTSFGPTVYYRPRTIIQGRLMQFGAQFPSRRATWLGPGRFLPNRPGHISCHGNTSMKRLMFVLAVSLLVVGFQAASAQRPSTSTAPAIAFDSVPDFLKLPTGMNFGEVPGVAVDSRGLVPCLADGQRVGPGLWPRRRPVARVRAEGESSSARSARISYGWAFAHSVRVDRNDEIWAIDKGSDMIIRLNRAGRVVWVFGRRQESADGAEPWEHTNPPQAPQDGRFRQPTDIAWDSQGNSYITDGYVNSRVAKFSKAGDWVKSFGEPGTDPGQFRTPHAIAIDTKDNIYIGDRGNRRVQIFDTEGKYLREWSIDVPPNFATRAVNGATPAAGSMNGVGAPNSLCITPGPTRCCSSVRALAPAGSSS